LATRNFIYGVGTDLRLYFVGELVTPKDLPLCNDDMPLGVEDIRLFNHNKQIWFSGTVVQTNAGKMAEIMYGSLGSDRDGPIQMYDWKVLRSPRQVHEKNWAPITEYHTDTPTWVYSYDPQRLYHVKIDLRLVTPQPPIAAHTWSGSTQAISWESGWLVIIHEKMYYPEMKITRRWYQQRFVLYDHDWNMQKISRRFQFDNGETEFPCGMCVHPDGKRLVISYGVLDREAWLATLKVSEVNDMLYDVGEK
jgi:predicted GH43/DUF377 family glycosyl hydrolase